MRLSWGDFCLDFSKKTCIMGILNVTPDSFSDGGLFFDKLKAVEHALSMQDDGADIIDIGGQSTRPGAEEISEDEEIERVIPVITALSGRLRIPISIDTYRSSVAEQAINAGASMINDISGLHFDRRMPEVAARYKLPVVIMHMKGTPKDMQDDPRYDALIPEIMDYLREGIIRAEDAGVAGDMIVIDPGIGFGKTLEHNLQIIRHLDEFTQLEKPLLLGTSRKSFIGRILGGLPPAERIEGTAATVAIGIMKGANIIRVHDVKEMSRVAGVADAIKKGHLI